MQSLVNERNSLTRKLENKKKEKVKKKKKKEKVREMEAGREKSPHFQGSYLANYLLSSHSQCNYSQECKTIPARSSYCRWLVRLNMV